MATTTTAVKENLLGNTPTNQPMWAQQLRAKFRASVAHTFVITGNVRDMADNRLTLNTYLAQLFLQRVNGKRNFDLIIYYDRSNGLRFPTPEMENLFIVEAGLGAGAPVATGGVFPAGAGAGNKVPIPKDPATAFKLIEKVLRTDRRSEQDPEHKMHTIVVIDYAESLFPAGNWAMLPDTDRDRIVTLSTAGFAVMLSRLVALSLPNGNTGPRLIQFRALGPA